MNAFPRFLSTAFLASVSLYSPLSPIADAVAQSCGRWAISEIPSIGGDETRAVSVNNRNQVVGYGYDASDMLRGFIYENGGTTLLDPAYGSHSVAVGINYYGVVAANSGEIMLADPSEMFDQFYLSSHASTFDATHGMVDVHESGDPISIAMGLNDKGQVVGHTKLSPDSGSLPFSYHPETGMVQLPMVPGCVQGGAVGINNQFTALGMCFAFTANGPESHAYTYNPQSGVTDLGDFGSFYIWPSSISDSGTVVGFTIDYAPTAYHGFIYDQSGGMRAFPAEGRNAGVRPVDINKYGDVIGQSDVEGAFLYQRGMMLKLNDLVDPASEWQILRATAINDQRTIVGVGTHKGNVRGFVMMPLKTKLLCSNLIASIY